MGMRSAQRVKKKPGMEASCELLCINARERRRDRLGRLGEPCGEGLCATALGNGESIAGPPLSDEKIYVVVVELDGTGKKSYLQLFTLYRRMRDFNCANRPLEFPLCLGGVLLVRKDPSQPRFCFPTKRRL